MRTRSIRRSSRSGFTLLELSIVLVVMTVAVGMLSSTITSSSRIGPLMREEALAAEGARFELETLRAASFEEVFRRYNEDPDDDPEGPGTAPGMHFAVAGLDPRPNDPDGFVGRIEFPTIEGSLREDSNRSDLGMPRDLDLDGVVENTPVDAGHQLLPFVVIVEWQGPNGPRQVDLYSTVVAP